MKMTTLFIASMFMFFACQGDQGSNVPEVVAEPDPSSPLGMVQIPLDNDGNPDPSKVAGMKFDTVVFNFGTVNEGEIVEHKFPFVNTGRVALLISEATSSCGCTVPNYPKHPIPPGESGEIHVRFNTQGKTDQQIKSVSIIANTIPAKTKISLVGNVIPKS